MSFKVIERIFLVVWVALGAAIAMFSLWYYGYEVLARTTAKLPASAHVRHFIGFALCLFYAGSCMYAGAAPRQARKRHMLFAVNSALLLVYSPLIAGESPASIALSIGAAAFACMSLVVWKIGRCSSVAQRTG